MRLWGALYGMIWIVLVEFLLAMMPDAPGWVGDLHVLLGFGVIALAYANFSGLRATRTPGRIKRVAQATLWLSVLVALLGVLLFFHVGADWTLPRIGLTVYRAILFLHVLNAFAIITQAAAVAIAFDMWEDRVFLDETRPGEIPPPPAPAESPAPRS
jgi:hypothetical protein